MYARRRTGFAAAATAPARALVAKNSQSVLRERPMLENIDKLPLYFLALFHGFITAYIVYVLTDLDFSEAYFVLFVIFCSFINVLLVKLIYAASLCVFLLWQYFTRHCYANNRANTRAQKSSKA